MKSWNTIKNSYLSFKRGLSRIFLFKFFLLIPLFSFAQFHKPNFKQVPIEIDGATIYTNIIAIKQDNKGFLWMTTPDGLLKYDGYQFKNYRNIPGDSTSLNNNVTESLLVDHLGDIWIGTENGLSRYKADCDCFIQYPADTNKGSPTGFITAITEDGDHHVWIAQQNGGLFRYERESDSFTRFLDSPTDPNSLVNDMVRVLLTDSKNKIWIGTGYGNIGKAGGLVCFDPVTGKTKRFLHNPNNPNSLIDNRISALLEDNTGRILVGTFQNGLHYYDQEKDEFVRMYKAGENTNSLYAHKGKRVWELDPFISILYQDREGGFWIGTCGGGINYFEPSTYKVNQFSHNPADGNGISNEYLWSFYEDRSGQFWLGNLSGGGLHKMNPFIQTIARYPELNNSIVNSIQESQKDPETIYVGTSLEGLLRLNVKENQIQTLLANKLNGNGGDDYNIHAVCEDSEGHLWLGLENEYTDNDERTAKTGIGTLGRFDPKTSRFKRYVIPGNISPDPSGATVYSIAKNGDGLLWLAVGKSGLFSFDPVRENFRHYELPDKNAMDETTEINFVAMDLSGTLWVGDISGDGVLFKYNRLKNSFESFLLGYKPLCFYEDTKGLYWIGTANQGVVNISPDKSYLQQYTTINGLPRNRVAGIAESPEGTFWMTTDRGFSKFISETKNFELVKLPPYVFNKVMKASDGQLFFTGNATMFSFFPDQIRGNLVPPDVVLSGLKIAGKPHFLLTDSLGEPKKVSLTFKQNDLSFDYVGLHYGNPSQNRYKYKLAPYDQDWIEAGTQREARYTNLDPGVYQFQVIGANDNNVWNDQAAEIQVLIHPPWWAKWWAYALFIIVTMILLYSFYHFQLNRKLEKAEAARLKELDVAKNRLFTNITHEFRTPLTVISGMSEQIREYPDEWLDKGLTIINRNSARLNTLVNQMLDLGKLESGKLKLDLVQADIIPFVKYLCESFNSTTEASQLKLTVYAETEELVMDFDSAKLTTVIINLLSNAIKFTPPGGKIIVHFKRLESDPNSCFLIKVKDNGSGISKDELNNIFNRFYQVDDSSTRFGEGTGIGLALTKELVELMGGDITVKSKLGKGSEFEVQIPITNNATMTNDVSLPYEIPKFEADEPDSNLIAESDENSELPLALIIEDNEDVARYLKICLKEKYNVLNAKDGIEGLELAYEKIPDIVISDVMMPGKDGFEVCATLKKDERTDHIPVILLTAKATLQDRISGLSHGADAYLTKPFNKAELFTRLNQLMLLRKKMIKRVQKDPYTLLLKKQVEGAEASFLNKTIKQIHEHMDNHSFGAAQLAFRLGFSESQVYRKLKATTGKSTALFIRSVRLQRAKELILSTDLTISEISYEVGFNDPSWFSRVFKEEFGYPPSDLHK